jgi:integrase
MARKVKDKELDTAAARARLKPRGKPYWRALDRGLHIGYRRLKDASGTWVARLYLGSQTYRTESIGMADDLAPADGITVLDFWQAQGKARELQQQQRAGSVRGPITVADAMDEYIEHLTVEKSAKTVLDTKRRAEGLILPTLGTIAIADLTADRLRDWRNSLAKAPARQRTRPGAAQNHRAFDQRARRATANRTWTILRAALNLAFRNDKVDTDPWRKVAPFAKVDSARVRWLKRDEAVRLINAAAPDFRMLVQAALATGCRYSELARLVVEDFEDHGAYGTVRIQQSKSGKPRHVIVRDEGRLLFKQITAGRASDEPMLRKADGSTWGECHQTEPMKRTCLRAKIKPANFHSLRHTWASHAVQNGVPLLVVAKNLGHRDVRMIEKHYGHLAPSYIIDTIKDRGPTFGFAPDAKIATFPQK